MQASSSIARCMAPPGSTSEPVKKIASYVESGFSRIGAIRLKADATGDFFTRSSGDDVPHSHLAFLKRYARYRSMITIEASATG